MVASRCQPVSWQAVTLTVAAHINQVTVNVNPSIISRLTLTINVNRQLLCRKTLVIESLREDHVRRITQRKWYVQLPTKVYQEFGITSPEQVANFDEGMFTIDAAGKYSYCQCKFLVSKSGS